MFFNRLKRTFKRLSSKFTWKRRFPGNTWLGENVVGVENIEIGKGTYGCINILTSATNPRLIIGSFCSIAKDVTFVIEDDHPMNLLSTFPFRVKCLGESVVEASGKGGIVIEDDVWLGYRATVLDGVKIGQGGLLLLVRSLPRMFLRTPSLEAFPHGLSGSASTTMLSICL